MQQRSLDRNWLNIGQCRLQTQQIGAVRDGEHVRCIAMSARAPFDFACWHERCGRTGRRTVDWRRNRCRRACSCWRRRRIALHQAGHRAVHRGRFRRGAHCWSSAVSVLRRLCTIHKRKMPTACTAVYLVSVFHRSNQISQSGHQKQKRQQKNHERHRRQHCNNERRRKNSVHSIAQHSTDTMLRQSGKTGRTRHSKSSFSRQKQNG